MCRSAPTKQTRAVGCDKWEVSDDADGIEELLHKTHTTRYPPYPNRYRRGVTALYHFTSINNLPNIRRLGALCSKQILMEQNCWPMLEPGGDRRSHRCDLKNGNWNKVSLNFTPHTPMFLSRKEKKQKGDKVCFFVIEMEAAGLRGVEFSNARTTDTRHAQKAGLDGLTLIDFKMILSNHTNHWVWPNWRRDVQAEILIPNRVDLQFVKEIAFENATDLNLGQQKWGDPQSDIPPFTVAPCLFTDDPHYCYAPHYDLTIDTAGGSRHFDGDNCMHGIHDDLYAGEPTTSFRALLKEYVRCVEASGIWDLVKEERNNIRRSQKVCENARIQFFDSCDKLSCLIDKVSAAKIVRFDTYGKMIRHELSRLRGSISWAREMRGVDHVNVDCVFNEIPMLTDAWHAKKRRVSLIYP